MKKDLRFPLWPDLLASGVAVVFFTLVAVALGYPIDFGRPEVCKFNIEASELKEDSEPWKCRLIVPGQVMTAEEVHPGLKVQVVSEIFPIGPVFTITSAPYRQDNGETRIDVIDHRNVPWRFTLENFGIVPNADGTWRNNRRLIPVME